MIHLEKKHIEHLYDFVQRHFVPWYDVQTELVDHLASGIEQLSEEHPDKSFEQLLELEFKKFGVHGFEDVVDNKRKALTRIYAQMTLKRIADFFQWPVILKSAVFAGVIYFVLSLYPKDWVFELLFFSTVVLAIIGFIRLSVKKNKVEYFRDKKWLLQDIILQAGGGAILFILPVQIIGFTIESASASLDHFIVRLGFSLFFVLYLRALQVVCWVLPRQMDEILSERYSNYKYSV